MSCPNQIFPAVGFQTDQAKLTSFFSTKRGAWFRILQSKKNICFLCFLKICLESWELCNSKIALRYSVKIFQEGPIPPMAPIRPSEDGGGLS